MSRDTCANLNELFEFDPCKCQLGIDITMNSSQHLFGCVVGFLDHVGGVQSGLFPKPRDFVSRLVALRFRFGAQRASRVVLELGLGEDPGGVFLGLKPNDVRVPMCFRQNFVGFDGCSV